jgi:hypothetical protein
MTEKERDLYLSDYPAIKRLVMEWTEHEKAIIAIDYDNTIFDCHELGLSFDYMKELLKRCQDIGAVFIVYTHSPKSRHDEIKEYMNSIGINIDYINEPHIELADGTGKLFYNILLDDRAGLRSAFIILDKACDIMDEKPDSPEHACKLLSERFGKEAAC